MSSPPPKPQNIVITRYEDKTDARGALKAGPKARMKGMHHHVDPIAEIATKLNLRLTNSSSFRRILTGLAAPRFPTDQGDINDVTLAAFPHEGEHRLNHSYGSKNVDRKLSSYLLQWGLLDRRLQTVSGIVYENIDGADLVLNLRDHRRHFLIIGYIENPCERLPRNLVVEPLSGFLISCVFRERWILPRRRKLRTVIEEAMRQGDLRKDIDPELAMDMLYAPIYYRLQIGSGPLSKSFVNGLLEQAREGLGP